MSILLRSTLERGTSRGRLRIRTVVFGRKRIFGVNCRMRFEGHPDIFQSWIHSVLEEVSSDDFDNGPEKNKTSHHQPDIGYRCRSHSPDPLMNYLVLLSINATIVACHSGHSQAILA